MLLEKSTHNEMGNNRGCIGERWGGWVGTGAQCRGRQWLGRNHACMQHSSKGMQVTDRLVLTAYVCPAHPVICVTCQAACAAVVPHDAYH